MAVIDGRAGPDCRPPGRQGGRVYDVKTGYQESASHIVQVQIYMYLSAQIKLGLACGTWAGAWTWTKDSKAR